jgi:LuxR family quorum-sensing system transcriptional regulator SolR
MNIDKYFQARINEANEMREICSPLTYLGICGFFFVRIHNNGTYVNLSTHLEWSTICATNLLSGYYPEHAISDHYFMKNDISLWSLNSENIIWQEGEKIFGFGNGVSICKKYDEYHDVYCFHSTKENSRINEFYITNINLLYQFISYFKEKATPLIKQSYLYSRQHNIIVPKQYCENYKMAKDDDSKNLEKFVNSITTNNITIENDLKTIKLTHREMEILHWILQAKSSDEISKILNISTRTVESHVNSLKIKFDCFKITRLVVLATKMGLDKTLEAKYQREV